MKKMRIQKILLLISISIFALFNISWFLITSIKYQPYIEVIPKNEYGFYGFTDEEGYNYNVKKPDYLSYTGNLGITDKNNEFALIIWPKMFGKYKYGLRIQKDNEAYEIYVNENLEPILQEDNESIKSLIEKYKPEISKLFTTAKETWDLK
jgi:hypothetical protein